MAKLTMLVGLPGAGKSTWRERFVSLNPSTVIISQDDLVDEFASEAGITYTEAFKVAPLKDFEREVKRRFDEAVAHGQDIILDRTNLTRKGRALFLNKAKGYAKEAVVFTCDPQVLQQRLDARAKATGKIIPTHIVKMMQASYQEPDLAEFDVLISVDTPAPTLVQKIQAAVTAAISAIRPRT